MKKTPSRTNSQIVHAFTLARQEMELEVDKKRLADLVAATAKRREERDDNFNKKKDKEKKKAGFGDALSGAEKYKSMDEHRVELEELFSRLGVDPNQGLSNGEAADRNAKYGDNAISGKKKTPWYLMLLKELTGFFPMLLWVGGILSLIAYALSPTDPSNLYLGVVLFVVNFLTGFITYTQNAKSEAIVEAFKNFIPPKTKCLRGGSFTTIDAAKLVPGDIIELKGGDRVPADVRILFAQEMRVDNSSLTGESDPLLRTVECTNKENPLETDNLAFFGTLVKEGIGKGIVIQIGDSTVIGQIANLASSAGVSLSPLRTEINRFIFIIAAIAITSGLIFFCLGFAVGYDALTNVIFTIGIIVANVPEGLLATVTAALTITARRLSQKKVLVKNLEAVETLGSTSCICSDKTGTLTQNKMTVENIWYGGSIKKGQNYQKFGPNHSYEWDVNSSDFKNLQESAMLCSEAVFDNSIPLDKVTGLQGSEADIARQRQQKQEDWERELNKKLWLDRPAIGDASETALIKFFQPIEDVRQFRGRYPIKEMNDKSLAKIPFNSSWKYALTICDVKTDESVNCIFIKGAPEKIWQLSSHILIDGQVQPIDEHWKKEFARVNRIFGDGGERVLGFAKMHLPKDKYPEDYQFNCKNVTENNFPMKGFTFTGLFSLIDPPRDAVPYSVLKCKTAGIKVIMVTGDQPVTAAAIARQVNIFGRDEKTVNQICEEQGISMNAAFDKSDAIVIHGDLITQATKEDELLPESERGRTIAKWLEKPRIVFARTTPAQKLIIVKACQAQGHIVAVTGDGVNDSPAIKKADIGIAMGVTGSDVAKDAADMVLLTDDFAAIIVGIEEGRRIFDNLKKSIIYALTANIPELLPFLALIFFRFPLPISTILMLCICIGTDIIPAIAFSSEEAELGIMTRPPRRKTEHMVTARLMVAAYPINGFFQTLGGFLTYFVIMRDFGLPLVELFGLATKTGFVPAEGDQLDINAPYFGTTNKDFIEYCENCWSGKGDCDYKDRDTDDDIFRVPDWLYNEDKLRDLRLFYLKCGVSDSGQKLMHVDVDFGECRVKQIDLINNVPVCYSTTSLKYAQTGFFFSVVIAQISNAFNTKTRLHSVIFSGLTNFSLLFGFCSEAALTLLLAYAKPVNVALNTRSLIFLHYGIPAIPFSIFSLLYEEWRKFMVRNMKSRDPRKPNWFVRNTYW
jgi:sodium/potassium-transporting ATPase subunit alpha